MSVLPPKCAPEDWQEPDWWHEVIEVRITSKTDAKRIIKLCHNGTFVEAWKPWYSYYQTSDGRVRPEDFENAEDVLNGNLDPDPGRPKIHDWDVIDTLIGEVLRKMSEPKNNAEVCRQVSVLYFERHGMTMAPENGGLKKRVREYTQKT